MISNRLMTSHRLAQFVARRHILSSSFSLDKEWSSRFSHLQKLSLGGDYEWISAVQKKFIGGGIASAVDVDAALCLAEQKDQVSDVVDLVYKLRHSENAADLAPSSEYALIRLLLKHEPETIIKLADDPINYGVFLNEHSACLAIDYFVKRNNLQAAAKLSSWVMQQEMLDNQLLNLLGLYSCTKWAELPLEEQTLPREEKEEEEEISEDDMKTFKFPYLKNPHFDNHFDLVEPSHLIGKTLLWMSRNTKNLTTELQNSIQFLGALLFGQMQLAESLASPKIIPSISLIAKTRLEPKEGEEIVPQNAKILEKLGSSTESSSVVASEAILEVLEKVKSTEETSLCKQQVEDFEIWNKQRNELVKAQAERIFLKIKAEEIEEEVKNLESQKEKMFFFDNRLKWEKKANENKEIWEERAKTLNANA